MCIGNFTRIKGRPRKPISFFTTFLFLAAGISAGGCAFTDITLKPNRAPVLGAISSSPYRVCLTRLTDQRRDMGRIGCKKNGFGSDTADILLEVSPGEWFRGAIEAELRQSGLKIVRASDPQYVRIEVDLVEFFLEPDVAGSLYSLIDASITVGFPDGSLFARRFVAVDEERYFVLVEALYTELLIKTVNKWMMEAVTEIVSLIINQDRTGQTVGTWHRVRRSVI